MKTSAPSIEPLEARIAPAVTIFVTDIDGDLVTITSSKGTLGQLHAAISPFIVSAGNLDGYRINKIDLSTNPVFEGADLTVTATPQLLDPDGDNKSTRYGDGFVNIGRIDATGADGGFSLNLGKVTIDGDLTVIDAGTGTSTPALKSLTAYSLGVSRYDDMNLPDFKSDLLGSVGPLKVKSNVEGVRLIVSGSLDAVTIGGSFRGEGLDNSGHLEVGGSIGSLTIGGDLRGGVNNHTEGGTRSGYIISNGKIGNITIGGSIIGGGEAFSGSIYAYGQIGNVVVKGSMVATVADTGGIGSDSGIGNVTVGGSIIGNGIGTEGSIGAVKIAGSLAGHLFAHRDIGAVNIGGSVTGGYIQTDVGAIASLKIGRDAEGVSLRAGSSMGAVSIGGDFEGASLTAATLTSLTVGGSVTGGAAQMTGYISIGGSAGTISIGGDLAGSFQSNTGMISVNGNLKTLKIGGDLKGESAGNTGYVRVTGLLGSATILGSIIGGDYFGSNTLTNTGALYVGHLGKVTLGGSLLAGANIDDGDLIRSGWIVADYEIGAITIKGSMLGAEGNQASIFAYGRQGNPAINNIAIKSISIGGDVDRGWIFAGTGPDGSVFGGTGEAQIGTVSVGGDWIASNLGAGVSSADGTIGNGNDTVIGSGTGSKIASIVIKGQVLGDGSNRTYAFMAHTIGSFKYSGNTVPLKAGPGNDLLASGSGLAVGPSLSPPLVGKPDPYAVHVYEV